MVSTIFEDNPTHLLMKGTANGVQKNHARFLWEIETFIRTGDIYWFNRRLTCGIIPGISNF